jgi:hypothetical protein
VASQKEYLTGALALAHERCGIMLRTIADEGYHAAAFISYEQATLAFEYRGAGRL